MSFYFRRLSVLLVHFAFIGERLLAAVTSSETNAGVVVSLLLYVATRRLLNSSSTNCERFTTLALIKLITIKQVVKISVMLADVH